MKIIIIALLTLPLWLQAQMSVAVSLQPQAWFVEQIAGDRAKVVVMIPPGSSPHSYEPRPAQMAALSDATLYLAIGVEFEQAWLPRFSSANPHMRVVHTDRLISKIEGEAHHHHEDGHHDDRHDHPHGLMDRLRGLFGSSAAHPSEKSRDLHIWTSPQLALIQARAIAQALAQSDPEGAATYWQNFALLADRILEIDIQISRILSPYAGATFLVHHPAWGYFAEDYGLNQASVEVDGKEPKPAQLQTLIAQSKQMGSRTIFVQPQFSARSAEVIAEAIGGEVQRLDPLAYAWDENLLRTAQKLKTAFDAAGR